MIEGTIESVTIAGRSFPVVSALVAEADSARLKTRRELGHVGVTKLTFETFAFTKRQLSVLTTGRPRPPRWLTKDINRARRALRREMVRGAGRARGRRSHWKSWARCFEGWELVSVPRSLRPMIGRYLGAA